MMNGNAVERGMKRILYFLIGFSFSLFGFRYVYANEVTCGDLGVSEVYDTSADAQQQCLSDLVGGGCDPASQNYGSFNVKGWRRYNSDFTGFVYYWYTDYTGTYTLTCTNDSDDDGIPDNFDLKPDSSEAYKASIVSVCYDQNNKVVAGVIQDEEGNLYSFGALPKGEDGQLDLEGHTISKFLEGATYYSGEELSSKLQNLDIDDLNITKNQGVTDIKPDGTFQFPDGWFDDYWKEREKQTKAPEPDTPEAPSETPDPNDDDSGRLDKIIKNTASTNTNLDNIQKYLGITNDYLAKINDKTGTGTSSSSKSGGAFVSVNTPTADEIGQAVEDNLIDPGQTIDKTITDNIPDLDQTDTLTAINTKYSDRYDLFITTLKESDLFSLPFEIFSGPSGSGSSVQTVNIGKWGSSSEQTATIDYSDYDNIWQVLRSVLLLVTSFACFKILVLKKG